MEWLRKRRLSKARPFENETLIADIRRAEQEWKNAEWRFQHALGDDHVDYAIYCLEAAEKNWGCSSSKQREVLASPPSLLRRCERRNENVLAWLAYRIGYIADRGASKAQCSQGLADKVRHSSGVSSTGIICAELLGMGDRLVCSAESVHDRNGGLARGTGHRSSARFTMDAAGLSLFGEVRTAIESLECNKNKAFAKNVVAGG